ncbi:MAG: gluconate 2-dehydrogenase subunit 3 family protein [Chitinophagaceae bacterium]|nr:gluconate 2-dehydrogenase subunit 3 family protein [Chitinophagaceae bacterium]
MPLTRRQALRQFLFVSAGVALIPSCMEDRSKSSILLKNLQISTDQEKLLAELAETIIPKTSSPGAKDLSAHLFALKMIDDCRSKEDQDRFIEGLKAFEKMAGKDFARQSMQERAKILEPLEKDKDAKEPAAAFYRTMKRLTIQAYTSSEYFLTKVQVYEMVPGRYHGCVPVKAS